MTEHYRKHYLVLGIPAGASWKQLRQAYKKLVNTWHPDRFQQNVRKKKQAEEKTKEITQAYKELADYYRQFGVLPLPTDTPTPALHEAHSAPADSPAETAPSAGDPHPPDAARDTGEPRRETYLWRARLIAGTAVLGSVIFLWQFLSRVEQGGPSPANPSALAVNADSIGEPMGTKLDDKRFMIGSSLGEVYSIQGVPTKTENDIWHYGNSRVYFSKGKVFGWDESRDSPLRIDIVTGHNKTSALLFARGSTKEEVLAVQGKPDRDLGSVWDYGVSRVYFENDRVTRWYESSLNPLYVRR